MFKQISDKVSLPDLERDVLAQWQSSDLFKKSLDARKDAPDYTFYEGPPTANGRPGIHHVFARTIKDLVPLPNHARISGPSQGRMGYARPSC